MRIAIIGGAGWIGHHLALRLKAHGQDVLCVDSLSVNNLNVLGDALHRDMAEQRLVMLKHAGVPLFIEDATDYQALSHMVAPWKPDVIVHLGAVAHINRANDNPVNCFNNSLRTLLNSLDVARAIECRVVYFSSSTVYGNFSKPIIDETEELTPFGIYGNMKLAGERMCRGYNDAYGVPITIVRPQALYGARCVSGRVTQVFIERAMAGEPLIIQGDGTEKHDFTYIGDLLAGMDCVLRESNESLRIFNITGENATSLSRLAEIVTARYPVEVKFGPKDPDRPKRGTMSVKKIREIGFRPKFDIETGMNLYMESYLGPQARIRGNSPAA
jgi:nucleoside-diphosphate-sugar epimerase